MATAVPLRALSTAAASLDAAAVRQQRVLFFGTDKFALRTLAELHRLSRSPDSAVAAVEVVCPPPRGRKRGAQVALPVRSYAEEHDIPVHTFPDPTNTTEKWGLLPAISAGFDLGVVVSFGHLIPSDIITAFRAGTMNLHPSALPRHRGASPIQYTIMEGDTTTAATVIELSAGLFDHGRVLHQVTLPVPAHATFDTLGAELAEVGAQAVAHTIANFDALYASGVRQDELDGVPTRAPKITKRHGEVNWAGWTTARFHAVFRALGHQIPIQAGLNGKPFHIVGVCDEAAACACLPDTLADEAAPGTAVFHKPAGAIFVRCADGWVGVTELSAPNNKGVWKRIPAGAFANGHGLRKTPQVFDGLANQ